MILFDKKNKIFSIKTNNTMYGMQVVHDKYVAHLYYGKKTDRLTECYKEYPVDFAPYVADVSANFSLDTILTELSFFDSGDTKDVALKIRNVNGDSVTRFDYVGYDIFKGRLEFENMPYSRGGEETLEIIYKDGVSGCELHSYYTVFPESDTITRYARFVNKGESPLILQKAVACQLDLLKDDYMLVSLCGTYGKERNVTEYPLHVGVQSVYSKRGHSSHQFNPFLALKTERTTENDGDAYAFEFVYSGDFKAQAEKTYDGKVRVLMGLNPDTFAWNLDVGESFTTPEVIMTYSAHGMNKLSQNLHDHIRAHIIPEKFVFSARPIVINTWEAMYFNINEEVIIRYAEKARKTGIDTVVIDDGWFGQRDNDSIGLGDWYVNEKKFPHGLKNFSERIHGLGLKLGIWIEPEMINPLSALYKEHPEWVLQCKDRECSLGRRQLVLDLTNDAVIEYIVEKIKKVFDGVQLEYIKWDFNRTLSEVGSLQLPAARQCEAKHRFTLGSYKLHQKLTEAFPDVLFEGCSGGGGRFDAGILYYCPQIWTSDNTDPVAQLEIQRGTSMAYPLSCISVHVSDSRFNCLERKPDYDFRFNVAQSGILGYEMNITRISDEEEEKLRAQVALNKQLQPLLLRGDCYSLEELKKGEYGLVCVAKDKSNFVVLYRNVGGKERRLLKVCGLDKNKLYIDDKGRTYSGETACKDGIEICCPSAPYVYECVIGKAEY